MKNELDAIITLIENNTATNTRGQTYKGWFPIELFNEFEDVIRLAIKNHPHYTRVIYRGPRISNNVHPWTTPSMTRRCDATHVVLN